MASVNPWVVLLIRSRAASGVPVPFRQEADGTCPLERILQDLQNLTPADRILPVVLEQDRPWWNDPLAELPVRNQIEEPFDRGTGTGLMVALGRLAVRQPVDPVVVLHSRFIFHPEPLGRVWALLHEVPKTPHSVRAGVSVGYIHDWLSLYEKVQPELTHAFFSRKGGASNLWRLPDIYPFLPFVSLEQDVLRARTPRSAGAGVRDEASRDLRPGLWGQTQRTDAARAIRIDAHAPRIRRAACCRQLYGTYPGGPRS